jgi:hypothetical protein
MFFMPPVSVTPEAVKLRGSSTHAYSASAETVPPSSMPSSTHGSSASGQPSMLPVIGYGGQLPPQPATEIPSPGSLTMQLPSAATRPLETISKRFVSWLNERKYIVEPGASPDMFGIVISTGGSKSAPLGCKVHANAGAAPSGNGIGRSSTCTWLSERKAGFWASGTT